MGNLANILENKMALRNPVSYTIGCDPELFLVDKTGAYRSAHDLLPGSKDAPFGVPDGALQPDGTAAEFNISPAVTSEAFCNNIRSVLGSLSAKINERNPELSLKVVPTAVFDPDYFKGLPAEALAFGCEPDFNAYTSKQNKFNPTKEPFRTGAGHVHIGWTMGEAIDDTSHFYDCMQATRQLDAVLYFSSLLWDRDSKRRELYGKIGAFRPKSYGVEYRSISNAWVADPDLHVWVFEATKAAMELLDRDDTRLWEEKLINEHIEDARAGVDTSEADLLDLHEDLVCMYGIPRLPDSYIKWDSIPF